MGDIARRSAELDPINTRAEIAAMRYEGAGSVSDAAALREKMAAAAELAKRAGQSEVEWMLTAREAERALGRMILAAREAGQLATGLGRPDGVDTLDTMGISRDLGADVVVLARVPDEDWRDRVAAAAAKHEATYGAVVRWARAYVDQIDAVRSQRDLRLAAAERAACEAQAQVAQLRNAEVDRPPVPPLLGDETSMAGAELALRVLVPEQPKDPVDNRPEVQAQEALVHAMSVLAARIKAHDPVVTDGIFRDAALFGARDTVRRLVDNATVWLRTLNELYTTEGSAR